MLVESGKRDDDERVSWATADETRLIEEMRRGVSAAFAEVYRRFAPLLARMAKRRKVPEADRDVLIMEHLEDTLIPILRAHRVAPVRLGPYLAAGFRRRLISAWRARSADDAHRAALIVVAPGPTLDDRYTDESYRERVVAEGLSEYALRAARGPEEALTTTTLRRARSHADGMEASPPGDDPIRTAREGLAAYLAEAMTPQERQLMGQVAERYPQREIAATYGVAPAAMRVRIHRIRERLMRQAAHYIGALQAAEGILLAQFLATPRGQRTRSPALGAPDGGPPAADRATTLRPIIGRETEETEGYE